MAKLYFKDKPIIGLDISQTGMKVMSADARKWLVTGYGSVDLDPAKIQASLGDESESYLEYNLKELLSSNLVGSLPSNHAVISVPTARTFTRTFSLPVEAEKTLNDAIALEIEQYIPLPIETLYVDYDIIERNKETLTISMSAVPRILVDRCVAISKSVGLVPVVVEPGINAVARLLELTEEGHLPTVIIDIGPAGTDIAILDGSIRVSGSTTIGSNTFTLEIAKRLKVPLENAHQLKVLSGLSPGPRQQKLKAALTPSLDRILAETKKVIRYYNERVASKHKLEQVLIVGGGSNLPGIGEFFTDGLVMPARVASPWLRLNFDGLPEPAKQFRARYSTVAGLSLVNSEEIWK